MSQEVLLNFKRPKFVVKPHLISRTVGSYSLHLPLGSDVVTIQPRGDFVALLVLQPKCWTELCTRTFLVVEEKVPFEAEPTLFEEEGVDIPAVKFIGMWVEEVAKKHSVTRMVLEVTDIMSIDMF